MKIALLIPALIVAFALNVQAEDKKVSADLEIPRDDGKIVNLPVELQFDGQSPMKSQKITILFSKKTMGVENQVTVERQGGHWADQTELVEQMDCTTQVEDNYEFICRIAFNKEHVVNLVKEPEVTPDVFSLAPMFLQDRHNMLLVDSNILREQLVEAGSPERAIQRRLESVELFLNEPVAYLKYR